MFHVMNRTEFHQMFNAAGPVVTPVVHVVDVAQASKNIDVALDADVAGVFLINHDFPVEPFLPIVRTIRARYPDVWMGLNFLAVTGEHAFPVLSKLQDEGCRIDAYWADDACIDEHAAVQDQTQASRIKHVRESSGWDGFYLGGTCFKKQREVSPEHYGVSAGLATHFMDAVCTSGGATGIEADAGKIEVFRQHIGEHVLALASGISPDNALTYSDVDCFMVATGINLEGDFYNIDKHRLVQLMAITREIGETRDRGTQ